MSAPNPLPQSFEVIATSGNARAGVLTYPSTSPSTPPPQPIETPSLLMNTYRGMPHNITLDLISTLHVPGFQISGAQL